MADSIAGPKLFPVAAAAPAASPAADAEAAELQAEVLGLFDLLRGRLLRYAMSLGLGRHDGEDVLQEVFLALFRHLQAGRSRENLPGWTFRTTHNLALKKRTSLHAEPVGAPPEELDLLAACTDRSPGPEDQMLFSERQRRLRAVFRALPETDQLCLRLRSEGHRYREIAAILGISLGSVAASLARSFERLERTDAR